MATQNEDSGGVGAIYNGGQTMTITDCTFSGNTGTAVRTYGDDDELSATFTRSAFTNNGFLAIFQSGGDLVVTDSTFSGNENGIQAEDKTATVTISGSTFTAQTNFCIKAWALMAISNSVFDSNMWDGTGSNNDEEAACIYMEGNMDGDRTLTLTSVTFSDNGAATALTISDAPSTFTSVSFNGNAGTDVKTS